MNILITGGSSGLGKAIVEKLANSPSTTVHFTYNNSVEQAKSIESLNPGTSAIKCDFRDIEEIRSLGRAISDLNLDVLINNAATNFEKQHNHKISPDYFLNSFRDNIVPTVNLTQKAISHFKRRRSGKIITILSSSIIGNPLVGWSSYIANKNYLHSMSKSWAVEYAKFNITSNCVSPSYMRTNLTKETDERIVEQIIKSNPLKKLLLPAEVAEVVEFLCTAPAHINGVNIVVNTAENVI